MRFATDLTVLPMALAVLASVPLGAGAPLMTDDSSLAKRQFGGAGNLLGGVGNIIPGAGNLLGGAGNLIPGGSNLLGGAGNLIPGGAGNLIPGGGNLISSFGNIIPGFSSLLGRSPRDFSHAKRQLDGIGNIIPGAANIIPGAANIIPGGGNLISSFGNLIPGFSSLLGRSPQDSSSLAKRQLGGLGNLFSGIGNIVPGLSSLLGNPRGHSDPSSYPPNSGGTGGPSADAQVPIDHFRYTANPASAKLPIPPEQNSQLREGHRQAHAALGF